MNYLLAKSKATELLLKQNVASLKTPIFNLNHNINIMIDTFSNYDYIVGKKFNWFGDSYLIHVNEQSAKNDKYLVLYDDTISLESRIRWCIAHEFGHAYLKHKNDDRDNEIEAHIFASHLLLPEVIVNDVIAHGYKMFIPQIFGVSNEAAKKFLDNHKPSYKKSYNDKMLLAKYRNTLNCLYEFYSVESMNRFVI